MNLTWNKTPGRFTDGETLKAGPIAVARIYTPMRIRGEPVTYAIEMLLPGFKRGSFESTVRYETVERAKERAERAVKTWFEWVQQ